MYVESEKNWQRRDLIYRAETEAQMQRLKRANVWIPKGKEVGGNWETGAACNIHY